MSTKKSNQKKVAKATAVEQPITEQSAVEQQAMEQLSQQSHVSQVTNVKIVDIVPNPANPRQYFDEESLSELAQNILEHGVLQPVTVREIPDDNGRKYELVFGERRFRAAKIAGLETLPCFVRELNDDAAFDLMVSENLQRQDILPSEEAGAFKSILERGYSIAYISERFGKSENFIHNRLILNRLIPEITSLLNREEISIGAAAEIARLEPELQENVYEEHLVTDIQVSNWINLPLKVFKDRLENAYTVQLSRFSFNKTECETCTFNSEIHSLFPNFENSRCTRSACLMKKQEQHMLDAILAEVGDENLDIYIKNGSSGAIHADVVKRLRELGIEVKYGDVYVMPENPVQPLEEDFAEDPAGNKLAQRDFQSKQKKWNGTNELIENGNARKVVILENHAPVSGYIMVPKEAETAKTKTENQDSPETSNYSESPYSPQSPDDAPTVPTATVGNAHATIKPDLISTLQEKDRKNREEALEKVTEQAIKLVKDADIPTTEILPFEEALVDFVLLSILEKRYFDFFGIPEGQHLTEEVALGMYTALTQEQRNVLKRNLLVKYLTTKTGVSKRSALLVEFAKHHFPVEMAEIESIQNDEYLKKREVIQEQIDKLKSDKDELQAVA